MRAPSFRRVPGDAAGRSRPGGRSGVEADGADGVVPAYDGTARMYDRMVGLYAFDHWRENFEALSRRHGIGPGRSADVACGTGLAARYLAQAGWSVYACDISTAMLREAVKATRSLDVRLLRQDMRYLALPSRVDLLVCASDSLNHLLEEADVARSLRAFRAALRDGGYALFDMNTIWQLREGRDTVAWELEIDGHSTRWFSAWDEDRRIATIRLELRGGEGGMSGPVVEVHRERGYEAEWMMGALDAAGFASVDVCDAAGLGVVAERTRRLQFVART